LLSQEFKNLCVDLLILMTATIN